MAAKDKLIPKATPKPQRINLTMPEIKIPDIKSDVQVDTSAIAEVVAGLTQVVAQVAQQQTAILKAIESLAGKEVSVDVAAPKVTVQAPSRPGSYYVEIDKENGETVGMRISAATLDA